MIEPQSPISNLFSPLMVFRSFLTVASGVVFSQMVYLGIAFALGYFFFPEFLEFFKLDDEAQKKIVAEDLESVISMKMFLAHLVLTGGVLFLVGWFSASVAPFAHFQHGLFIAVLVFVSFLQTFMADPPSKKFMDLAFMMVLPMCVLLGARKASAALAEQPEE